MNEVIKARVKSRFYPSAVWLFPILTCLVGAYLAYDYFANQGKVISIYYEDVSNVEAKKTKLKYLGVTVGEVINTKLADDQKRVLVQARLTKEYNKLAKVGSVFTLVQPEVGFQGVQGLDTLVSGPYIRVAPGDGKEIDSFGGEPGSPSGKNDGSTVSYFLMTEHADSLGNGDPVLFRGVKIGEVIKLEFSPTGQQVEVMIRIENRYVTFIRANSYFWISSGVEADIGILGAEIKVPTMQSLLSGGIVVNTPDPAGPVARAQEKFLLNSKEPENWRSWSAKMQLNE